MARRPEIRSIPNIMKTMNEYGLQYIVDNYMYMQLGVMPGKDPYKCIIKDAVHAKSVNLYIHVERTRYQGSTMAPASSFPSHAYAVGVDCG